MRFSALRAGGQWYQGCLKSLARTFYDLDLLQRLGISRAQGTQPVLTREEVVAQPWLCDELDRLHRYFKYTMEICSARSWSQSQFGLLLPHMLALTYLPNEQQRPEALQHIRNICDSVLLAEAIVLGKTDHAVEPAVKKDLRRCLLDMAWPQSQIGRECMAVLEAASYDASNYELRLQAFLLHARPQNTKFHLEDVFAGLADVVKRHSKSSVMTRFCKLNQFAQLFVVSKQ